MGPVAVIGGTGRLGFGLAARWARAGRRVIIGSRQEPRAAEAAARIRAFVEGADVAPASNQAAARAAEVIVLAIPYTAQAGILREIAAAARGKIVVDTTVPLRPGAQTDLNPIAAGSAAAQAQQALPEARVVAAFHTVSHELLARSEDPVEGDVLVCGHDPDAKRAVIGLAEALGMRGFDAGTLAQAATLERLAALIIWMNKRYGRRSIGVRLTGI